MGSAQEGHWRAREEVQVPGTLGMTKLKEIDT